MVAPTVSNLHGYFAEEPSPPTLRERDRLYDDRQQSMTAFHCRPAQKLTEKRPPRSGSKIEISHRMRTYVPDRVTPTPSDPFRLWIESGRRCAPFPPRWDPDYNSNVWRNFSSRRFAGYRGADDDARGGGGISELVADMYPMRIPPHSEMNDNTFVKFLSEVPMIRDRRRRDLAVARSVRELKDFKELKLRSEMRVPPLSERGDIAPPKGFRRYEHPRRRASPERTTTQSLRQMTELERDGQRGVLGTRRTGGTRLWKLTFRQNHPDYDKMTADLNEKRLHPPQSPIPGEVWFQ